MGMVLVLSAPGAVKLNAVRDDDNEGPREAYSLLPLDRWRS